MAEYGASTASAVNRPLTRIENNVEQLKAQTERINNVTERIMRHATALGYFGPPKADAANSLSPVVSNLSDALVELERAVDHLGGSMNLFE